jgi:hypothetical protein
MKDRVGWFQQQERDGHVGHSFLLRDHDVLASPSVFSFVLNRVQAA